MTRFVRRNAWVIGLFVIFGLLLVLTRAIQPNYGPAGIAALVSASLPFAFAVAAQTVVVNVRQTTNSQAAGSW